MSFIRSFTEFVGGASSSASVARCLCLLRISYHQPGVRRRSTYLALWNIESIPKSAAPPPDSTLLIFAFVGTIGVSSLRGLCEVVWAIP